MLQQQDLNKFPTYYLDQLIDMGKEIKEQFMDHSICLEFNPKPNEKDSQWVDLYYAEDETWTYIAYLAQVCKPKDIEELENRYNMEN